jgi:hypothetical protein
VIELIAARAQTKHTLDALRHNLRLFGAVLRPGLFLR